MAVEVLTYRVDNLETLMIELTRNVNRLSVEMRELKDEMRDFKDEMRDFKDEMSDFKDEMRQFREDSERERKELRRSLADLSRKMGTLAEDMVAPSIPRILEEIAHCSAEPAMLGVRIRKRLPDGRSQEFDVVAACDDILLINETKSRLHPEDISDFVYALQRAHDFFPEYPERRVVGALASFYVDPSLVTYGERQGLIMLGVIDGLMEVLNTSQFQLRAF